MQVREEDDSHLTKQAKDGEAYESALDNHQYGKEV